MVRALFRALAALTPVTPLVWDPALGSYCTLSNANAASWRIPSARAATRAAATPNLAVAPIPSPLEQVRARVHPPPQPPRPARRLTAADALFVPEIFQDNRLDFLNALAAQTPARLAAVCHDALAWSRPEVIPPARQAGFAAYLDTLGHFHHVIACSHETAADLRAFWQAHSLDDERMPPIAVHPWPVDHDGTQRRVIPPPAAGARRGVLCVGTFEPRKNHLALLDAAEQVWQGGGAFDLVLIGRTTAHHGARVLNGSNPCNARAVPCAGCGTRTTPRSGAPTRNARSRCSRRCTRASASRSWKASGTAARACAAATEPSVKWPLAAAA